VLKQVCDYLGDMAKKILSGKVHVNEYIITKCISKNPEDYANAQSLPHVQVALAMKKQVQRVKSGDFIQHIICVGSGSTAKSVSLRAFSPRQVETDNLIVDYKWYLTDQIYPPIARLLEPIKEIDFSRIKACLGIG